MFVVGDELATLAVDEGDQNDQLFFVAYAQMSCGLTLDKDIDLTDGHSPDKWRVTGVLQNTEAFAKAFQCDAGSYMNPEKKCIIW